MLTVDRRGSGGVVAIRQVLKLTGLRRGERLLSYTRMGHLYSPLGLRCTPVHHCTHLYKVNTDLPSSYFPGVYITHLVSNDKRIFTNYPKHFYEGDGEILCTIDLQKGQKCIFE